MYNKTLTQIFSFILAASHRPRHFVIISATLYRYAHTRLAAEFHISIYSKTRMPVIQQLLGRPSLFLLQKQTPSRYRHCEANYAVQGGRCLSSRVVVTRLVFPSSCAPTHFKYISNCVLQIRSSQKNETVENASQQAFILKLLHRQTSVTQGGKVTQEIVLHCETEPLKAIASPFVLS